MTIAIAIRTSSAVIFAADSKVTTQGLAGFEENGAPRWLEQTYDTAFKLAHDRSQTLMAMVAGPATLGQIPVTDFISSYDFAAPHNYSTYHGSVEELDQQLRTLLVRMQAEKRTFWEQVPDLKPEAWPGPTILLSAPFPAQRRPKAWRVDLSGADFSVDEILTMPFIQLEGAYDDVFSLLYGFRPELIDGIFGKVGVDPGKGPETLGEIRNKLPAPVDKLNLAAMPTQDAMDLAYFLASVQVQMDRFLPGTPACGGPIDLMVLEMAPSPRITPYYGKDLHHPAGTRP
jgi:hypothetical protein